MPATDLDRLLDPAPGDDPAGPDLEYDSAYLAAVQAAEGTPERQMGDIVVAAVEPDWRQVRTLATDLLKGSKDLRVAVLLARALLRLQGLRGFGDGLTLIGGLLERYWDGLHPRLDPEDDNDPTARISCLSDLSDRERVLDALRATPLVRSRVFGPIAYRDIEIAEGRASPPPDGKALDMAAIEGAFRDCDAEELQAAVAAAGAAQQGLRSILAALGERIRTDQLPSMDPLSGLLATLDKTLRAHLAEPAPGASDADDDLAGTPGSADTSALGAPRRGGTSGEIANRDDVVRTIDRICDYYSRYEPSSPVPLLLQRARRLATGSFVDIVRDLAPDAMGEIEKVCGLERGS